VNGEKTVRPAAFILAILALSAGGVSAQVAEVIYTGGDVVTIDRRRPSAEAVAIGDGKIVAVGVRAEVMPHRGIGTKVVDLGGKTLLPGFIDPHSHFAGAMTIAEQANCSSPPVGPVRDIAGLVAVLKAFREARGIPPGEAIIGYGYDRAGLADGRELTRDDLDPVFPDNPVIVGHVSMHGAVLNSAAMRRFGITAATATPPGGIIARKPGSNEPAGLVMETAYLPVYAALSAPVSPERELARLKAAQMIYAGAGITTAQEGATSLGELEALQRGAARGALFLDVVALPLVTDLDRILEKNPPGSFGTYRGRLKLGGVKIVLDGSPQGKTAYFTTPYLTGGPTGQADWRGEPSFPPDVVGTMVRRCYDLKLQTFVHANGDAAIDMLLEAHERAAAGDRACDRRTVAIHSQFVRPDQLDRYVADRIIPSFFTEHAYYFGAAHLANRGQAQASFLSPMKTALARGLRPTNHTDFVVTPIDQMMVLWTAVTRKSLTGEVIGPGERVTPMEALEAITINAAYQYREEATKGSIEPGKLADLVILDRNPMTVDPDAIRDIRVLETIKEGRTIYRRESLR
jgi:predicted amidohydrolase YtcJ